MKILCVGDVHIKVNNLGLIDQLENKIIETLRDNPKIEMVVLLGDILHDHERLHTLAMNRAFSFIKTLAGCVSVYVLVGNHDYIQNDQFLTENHWMVMLKNNVKNVTIVDHVEQVYFSGTKYLTFVPYVPNGRFVEALETTSLDWRGSSFIFAHQEFRGADLGATSSAHGDEWGETLPMIVSGHIHGKQWIGENIFYVGSPFNHNFGETSDSVMLEIDCKSFELREIPLVFPKRRTLYTTLEGLDGVVGAMNDVDHFRIFIQSSLVGFKGFQRTDQYKELIDRGVKVVCLPPSAVEDVEDLGEREHFPHLMMKKILEKRDEYLYSTASRILENRVVNPEDILIV